MRPFSGTMSVAGAGRVRDRLAATPDGPLRALHTGPHAAYFAVERPGSDPWCLGVVGTQAAAVPNALRIAFRDLRSLDLGATQVLEGALHLGSIRIRIGRVVDVQVPRRPITVPASDPAPLIARIGLGEGLTPYADDVLCGWLAIQRAAGVATPEVDREVRAAVARTTLLSATLLDCALHGEVLPEFAAYVVALGTPDQPDREAALAAVGESSGEGLLAGARHALGVKTEAA